MSAVPKKAGRWVPLRCTHSTRSAWSVLALVAGVLLATGLAAGATLVVGPEGGPAPLVSADAAPDGSWNKWRYEDLKALDPWGDSASDEVDIIAVYSRQEGASVALRVDLMDLRAGNEPDLFLAVDYQEGGTSPLSKGSPLLADLDWDLLLFLSGTGRRGALDADYVEHAAYLAGTRVDDSLDYVEFALSVEAMPGWDGKAFKMQAMVMDGGEVVDQTEAVSSDAAAGRAKLVMVFGNMLGAPGPNGISAYDGFGPRQGERPGVRRGLKYLLDAVEKYRLPLTTNDLRVDTFPGNEYLGINERLRGLAQQGLFDGLDTLTYGYYWPWQPADVDAKAIELAGEYRQRLGLPQSKVFYPYEAHLTVGDLATIKGAGYSGVYAIDKYGFWFGWITDWGVPNAARDWTEGAKKVHRVNGVLVFPGLQGFVWDERWDRLGIEPGWHLNAYSSYMGTDGGLHHGWRRALLDMALDPDQEKYITIGTDLGLTSWVFQEDVDRSARWIASHPWIEVATLSDLAGRGWTPVEHDFGADPSQPLDRRFDHGLHGPGFGINDYFWQNYYGGVSDGHSSLIPAGTRIEGYFDYVPYLRDGQPIPSGMKMGDDKTPGTIIYETLRNLQAAPGNSLGRLAWLAYFKNVAEGTIHANQRYESGRDSADDPGGPYLNPYAKTRANDVRQANKLVAAARWAEEAARGSLPKDMQLLARDLDLDGEDEYVMENDRVFAIFENDGGRLEYAFAYDPATGPVQLVAPMNQWATWFGNEFGEGESPFPGLRLGYNEGAFEDSHWGEGDFRFEVYEAEAGAESLTFVSPDGRIRKTFSLEGNTISARYVTRDLDYLVVGFGLTVNLDGMYSPAWWDRFSKVEGHKSVGWRNSEGGYAAVQFGDTKLERMESSLDTPVRQEMKEREDTSGFGNPYWMVFPLSYVKVEGQGEFDVGLTLAAVAPGAEPRPIPTAGEVTSPLRTAAPGASPAVSPGAPGNEGPGPLPLILVVVFVVVVGVGAVAVFRVVRGRR